LPDFIDLPDSSDLSVDSDSSTVVPWGILLVGGTGSRISGSCPKQFLKIGDKSLLSWAFTSLQSVSNIRGIVVVVNSDLTERTKEVIDTEIKSAPFISFVTGGKTRQDSVRAGLSMLPKECTQVWVHDSSRPFPGHRLIESLEKVSHICFAVIPGVFEKNTLKVVDSDNIVVKTVDRREYVEVQTPQVFDRQILETAHKKAFECGFSGTDCASLVERLNEPVRVVLGSDCNIKVTTDGDLLYAKYLITSSGFKNLL